MMYLNKCKTFQKTSRETYVYKNLTRHFVFFEWRDAGLFFTENKKSNVIHKKQYSNNKYRSEVKQTSKSVDFVGVLGDFAQAGM